MSALINAIKSAYQACDNTQNINKVHLEFLKANFILPIEKGSANEPRVLFLNQGEHRFLPLFSEQALLDNWAEEIKEQIDLLHLTGVNLLKGLGNDVFVCLNPGDEYYKEFHPQELTKLKTIVAKFFNHD